MSLFRLFAFGLLMTMPILPAGAQEVAARAELHESAGAAPATAAAGSVVWTRQTDESGQAMLAGRVDLPGRGIGASLSLRPNADASLPASHLLEVRFETSDAAHMVGRMPGVLAKDEPLAQGIPLSGASVQVTDNVFLFGLSAEPDALERNLDLMGSRHWFDIAIVYQSGERAILTLEKDAAAAELFDAVMADWQKSAAR